MPTFRDFLPPIITRRSERKDVLGVGDSGISAWMNMPLGEASYSTGRSFQQTVNQGFSANPILYRAVMIIARGIAGIPWQLYQDQDSQDRGKLLDSHPSLMLLNVQANKGQHAGLFWQYLVADQLLAGDAFIYAVRRGNGQPTELYALRPDWVKPCFVRRADGSEVLDHYEYGYSNNKQVIAIDDLLHLPEINPLRTGNGIAPAKVVGRSVDQMTAADDANTALQQNMARPSGILSPKDGSGLTPEQQAALKAELQEKYSGPKNAGRPLVPLKPMDWTPTGISPVDMDWLNGKEAALRLIGTGLGIAPELLGDADGKTFANMAEARAALYTEEIFPRMDVLAGALTGWLLPMYGLDVLAGGYRYDYDRDSVEAIQEDRGQVWDRAESASFLTINEKREMLGLKDIGPDGDVILVPNTMTTLDDLIEPPAPPQPVIHMLPPGNGNNKPSDPHAADGAQSGTDANGNDALPATGTDGAKAVMRPFASSARQSARQQRPGGLQDRRNSSVTRMR